MTRAKVEALGALVGVPQGVAVEEEVGLRVQPQELSQGLGVELIRH